MRRMFVFLCLLMFASSASAVTIDLLNWDIENNSTGDYQKIDYWGPNGAHAQHVNFAKPGYDAVLGVHFGYYSAGLAETVGQLTTEIIAPNTTYTFWSWAIGGGNDFGVILYQIGYAEVEGDLDSFVLLAQNGIQLGGSWVETEGVTYTTDIAGPEIGKELIVRLGDGPPGESDIWYDNFQATAAPIPEPGIISMIGLGFLGLLGLRRKK